MRPDVLSEKQYKTYDRVSRYSPFPYYYNRNDDRYIYGITAHLNTSDTPFVSHVVKPGDSVDSLALYYYNNPTYYWIILDFNRLQDPFAPLIQGTTLRIPTFSSINYDM